MDLICKLTDKDIGEEFEKIENPKLRIGARGIVIRDDRKLLYFIRLLQINTNYLVED